MAIFFFKDFKKGFILFILLAIMLVMVLVPLPQILPTFFDSWVPDFLQHKSIITYLQEHTNFFVRLIPFVGMFTLIVYLWRKK